MKQSPCTIAATEVSEIQSVHMQRSATRPSVPFQSDAFFSLLVRRSWVPRAGKQAGKKVVVPEEERTTSFVSKNSLQARLLCRLCGSLIAVGPGSYEILRRTIFFADRPSFLAPICLSLLSLSLSLSLSDVCVCVCMFYTKIFVQLPVS